MPSRFRLAAGPWQVWADVMLWAVAAALLLKDIIQVVSTPLRRTVIRVVGGTADILRVSGAVVLHVGVVSALRFRFRRLSNGESCAAHLRVVGGTAFAGAEDARALPQALGDIHGHSPHGLLPRCGYRPGCVRFTICSHSGAVGEARVAATQSVVALQAPTAQHR